MMANAAKIKNLNEKKTSFLLLYYYSLPVEEQKNALAYDTWSYLTIKKFYEFLPEISWNQ
jgi:hypothetical protein